MAGDAFKEVPKVGGPFDFVFIDAWKPDYKKYFDMVYPKLAPGGLLLAHNVLNKKNEMLPFLQAIEGASRPLHHDRGAVGRGHLGFVEASLTRRTPVKPVHIIGVPLDLGAGRRGVDMGPSALRIAGLGERITALGRTVVDKGDLAVPIPETSGPATSARSTSATSPGSARGCTRARSPATSAGALPLVLGGDHSLAAGSVAASCRDGAARGAAARPHLGRRARRHEHAGDDRQRQRARHAARGAARPGTRRSCR